MKKETLLYIGHEYHKKTKSAQFLLKLLNERYDVTVCSYSYETMDFIYDEAVYSKEYDYLVVFQVPVAVEKLNETFKYKRASYFPMYDDTGLRPDSFWLDYKDFNIISFSSTLHERLQKLGLSSHYIKYYPKPVEKCECGDSKSAFLWQRVDSINIHNIAPILTVLGVDKVHIHMAPDPGNHDIYPCDELNGKFSFTFSRWFNTKDEMLEIIKQSAYYIAPREYEGIGMSFLEAMSMGKCVIALDKPTMNEYITHGDNGFLYSPDQTFSVPELSIGNVSENAVNSVRNGHAAWENDKINIYSWIEQEPEIDIKKYKETVDRFKKKYSMGGITVFSKINDEWLLFGRFRINRYFIGLLKSLKNKK